MALVTELELPELDGEPKLGSLHGIYGLERLPLRWR
jgi:hypothetical protein